jgi:hypothetical protein
MLAVIEHQEGLPVTEELNQRVYRRPTAFLAHSENTRYRVRYKSGIRQGGQVHEPHAVPVLTRDLAGHREREPRLAGATGARQRMEISLAPP